MLEGGGRSAFRALSTLLTDLGALVQRERVKSPALLVIGDVAARGLAEHALVQLRTLITEKSGA